MHVLVCVIKLQNARCNDKNTQIHNNRFRRCGMHVGWLRLQYDRVNLRFEPFLIGLINRTYLITANSLILLLKLCLLPYVSVTLMRVLWTFFHLLILATCFDTLPPFSGEMSIVLWYDVFLICSWVDTRWQYYSTHLHTNNTQNNTMKQNSQNGIYITVRIRKLIREYIT